MKPVSLRMATIALTLLAPLPGLAQEAPQPGALQQPSTAYPPEQLDQILAPVALYPDPVLTDILTAATYPLEVVQAERWVSDPNNAALTGDQLTAALQSQDWDPSVKSLVPFPAVLKMMSDQLDWMQQLGNAFIGQQGDVMNEVQHLRQQAQANGQLGSTPQETVSTDAGAIQIEPSQPDAVSIPAYNPNVVYGQWQNPDYPPDYFVPPGYDYGPALDSGIYWGPPVVLVGGLFLWGAIDWHHHDIRIDRGRFDRLNRGHPFVGGDIWQHDPFHRRGVAYRDVPTQQHFQPGRFAGSAPGRDFRGFAQTSPVPQVVRPQNFNSQENRPQAAPNQQGFRPQQQPAQNFRPAPTNFSQRPQAFGGFASGAQVRNEAERGRTSMQTARPVPFQTARPVPFQTARPVPMRTASPVPQNRGGGGGGRPEGGGRGEHR
ncbi:MAG TPA: DUF3300 domain-containing protein [Aliidongia sp.]|nr:DUF3300 domain-containing protein [Aliidongia sp.]